MKTLNVSTSTAADRDLGRTLWPDFSLLGVACIWGVNIPFMKIGLEQIDLYVYNAIRLSISAAVLVCFALRERRRGQVPCTSLRIRYVIVYGLMIGAAYQQLFLQGISRTTSGNTALIIATVPMWTALLAWFFLGERLRPLAWAGLAISLVGTIVVALQRDVNVGRQHLTGNLIILASALTWAAGTVYSRPLLRKVSPMQLAAASSMIGLPVHLITALGNYKASLPALESVGLWAIILYSGSLSSGLSQPMWHFGVRHAGAAHAAVVQNLVPVFAIAAAWFSRGEVVTRAQLVGGALIISGLATMRVARARRTPERLEHK